MTSSLSILVLEDNQDLLDLVCKALSHLGHQPHPANSAKDGMRLLDTVRFDVLLADINLPGMLGSDFARLAIKKIPDIRVIFTSGFGYLITEDLHDKVKLIPKPYTINQLKDALEETRLD